MMKMFEFPTFAINSLLDKDYKESIEEVVRHCENKDLFDYLGTKYEDEDLRNFPRKEEANEYLYDFVHTFSEGDFRRKFGISNNGLCLIVAAFINS